MKKLFSFATFLFFLALLQIAPSYGQSQEPKELIEARNGYNADLQKAIKPVNDRYLPKLEELKKQLTYKGDIKGAVVVEDVITKMSSGQPLQQEGDNHPQELKEIKKNYMVELETAIKPVRSLYLAKLEVLKQQLALSGALKAALVVDEEMEKTKASQAYNGTITIDAKACIFGAGNAELIDPNALAPVKISLPPDSNRILKISRVIGTTGPLNEKFNFPADGGIFFQDTVDIQSYGGISGVIDRSVNGCLALMGVFTKGVPTKPAPSRLDVTNIKNQLVFEPILNQVFFIGDGLTGRGNGQIQEFIIPDEATELFLGFADAVSLKGQPTAYGDNTGALVATYSIQIRK